MFFAFIKYIIIDTLLMNCYNTSNLVKGYQLYNQGGGLSMKKIVAIGGGELSKRETYAIDVEIVKLSGKSQPKVLFVPTASFEPAGYCERFKNLYESELGGEVKVLYLLDNTLSTEAIEEQILWADIIYVGGGDTSHMLKVWQSKGVDQCLKKAYDQGTLLCGLSAGSICWFKYGQSEIDSEVSEDGYDYMILEGLNLIPAFHCPHFNEGRRAEVFYQMMASQNEVGIALENNCAIAIIGDSYRILTSEPHRKGYKIYKQGDQVITQPLEPGVVYQPLTELLEG